MHKLTEDYVPTNAEMAKRILELELDVRRLQRTVLTLNNAMLKLLDVL